jgi:hypothetical protein
MSQWRRSYVQQMLIDEQWHLDVGDVDINGQSMVDAEVELRMHKLNKLFRRNGLVKRRPTESKINKLIVSVSLSHANWTQVKKLIIKFDGDYLESYYKRNDTTTKTKSGYSLKFKLNSLFSRSLGQAFHSNSKKAVIRLKTNIEYRSTTSSLLFNSKMKSIRYLLNGNPLLIGFFEDGNASNLIYENKSLSSVRLTRSQCERRPYTIDFEKLGWGESIVEPRVLQAYYCEGSCRMPLDDSSHASNQAIIRLLTKKLSQGSFNYLPDVCCAPSKFASRAFLFYDRSGNIVLKKIDRVLVEACSCE